MNAKPALSSVSVNRLNNVFAELRGTPVPTIEMYSRALRKAGILPETKRGASAGGVSPAHAAQILFAIMRGSPINAASNTQEVSNLIADSSGGALMEPILQAELEIIGWPDGITLADAVGNLIERFARNSIGEIADVAAGFRVEIDRYWTTAELIWKPSPKLATTMIESYTAVFGKGAAAAMLDARASGTIHRPIRLKFHTPHLYAAKVAYDSGDSTRNREARAAFRASKAEIERFDVWGTEMVTHRTLAAIGELYRPATSPAIVERQKAITVPGVSAPGQTEEKK